MKIHTIFIGLAVFIVGGVLGYGISKTSDAHMGMHAMPDGTSMGNQEIDMSMQDMMTSMNQALEDKTGDSFDKAFLDEMIVHHEGAVGMAEAALKNAQHTEIKNMAQDIILAQTKEIEEMKSWRSSWYGE